MQDNNSPIFRVALANGTSKDYTEQEYRDLHIADWLNENHSGKYSVFRLNDAAPDSVTKDQQYMVSFDQDGQTKSKVYSGQDFMDLDMGNWLEANHAGGYRIQGVRGYNDASLAADEDYWKNKSEEQKAAIEQFDRDNHEFMSRHEMDKILYDAGEGNLVGDDYMQNDAKYIDLVNRKKRLQAEYSNNPYVQSLYKSEAEYADGKAGEYDSIISDMLRKNPLLGAAKSSMQSGTKAEIDEYEYYKQAKKLEKDVAKTYSIETVKAPGENGFVDYMRNYAKAHGDTFSDVDFWSRGLTEISRNLNVRDIMKRLESKGLDLTQLTEKDLDDNLTAGEKALLQGFVRKAYAQAQRAEDMAPGYTAGHIAAESLGYMAEFLVAGAIGRAVGTAAGTAEEASYAGLRSWIARELRTGSAEAIESAVKRGMINSFTKGGERALTQVMKKAVSIGSRTASGAYSVVVRPLEQAVWHTALQPSTYRQISVNLTMINENGELISAGNAIWGGVLDQMVENWSESMGGAVETVLGMPFKAAGWAGEKVLGKTTLGQWGRWLADSEVAKVLNQAGFNGLIGEMGEEWLGNAARVGLGIMSKDEFRNFASWHEQLEMAASFAPMSLFGLGTSTYAAAKQAKEYKKTAEAMRGVLNRAGMTEEEIAYIMDTKHTKKEIADALTPVIQRIVHGRKDNQTAKDDYITTLKFAQASAMNEVLATAQSIEKGKAREAMRNRIGEELGATSADDERGRFTHMMNTERLDADGNPYELEAVTTVRDADGNEWFYMGDNGSQVVLKKRGEQGGKPMFLTQEQYAQRVESGEYTENTQLATQFLDEQIEKLRAAEEQSRKSQEVQDRYTALLNAFRTSPQINLGTEDAPMTGNVLQVSRDGVIVDFGQPVLLNGVTRPVHKISLEQAGNAVGIDAAMRSDEQQERDAVDQQDLDRKRIAAYNNTYRGKDFTINGDPYTFVRMFEAPYLDEDGTELVKVTATDARGNDVEVVIPLRDLEEQALTHDEQTQAAADQDDVNAGATEETTGSLKDFRGNDIPMRINEKTGEEEVDKREFKKRDPEAYYRWNDSRRGGNTADSMEAIQADIAAKSAEKAKLESQKQSETDPDLRDELEEKINVLDNDINLLAGIYHKYDAAGNFQNAQRQYAEKFIDLNQRMLNAKTQEQYDELLAMQRQLMRDYYTEMMDSAHSMMLNQRVVEFQRALNEIADVPVQVVTQAQIEEVMRNDNATEEAINKVLDKLAEIQRLNLTTGRSYAMDGLQYNGKVYIFAEGNRDVAAATVTYYHERQHVINKRNPGAVDAVVALAQDNHDSLFQTLTAIIGDAATYEKYDNRTLADEIVAFTMEKAHTNPEYVNELKALGLSDELINIISTEYGRQQGTSEDLGIGSGDGTSRDSGSGQPDYRIDDQAQEGTSADEQLGSPYDGVEAAEEVDEGLSSETQQELADKGMVMDGGVVMASAISDLKQQLGYLTPNERNTDLDLIRYSVRTLEPWAANFRKYPDSEERIIRALENLAERMTADELVSGVISQGNYKYGKKANGSFAGPLRTNIEYVVTFDMDTTCPRTFQYLNYVKQIEKRIGRPLTQTECIQLTEMMRMYGQQIPCVYCYSENKRQAMKQYYTDFMTARQAVLNAATDEEALEHMYGHGTSKAAKESKDPAVALNEAAYKVFLKWRSERNTAYNPSLKMLWYQYTNDRNVVLTVLDQLHADGRIMTDLNDDTIAAIVDTELRINDPAAVKVVEDIVSEWKWDAIEGREHGDYVPVDEDDLVVDPRTLSLWREMTAYAKSASQAKSVLRYVPYTDELKKLSQEQKDYINGMGGVRMHSSNDFRIDYVFDYFQFMADMAANKMFGHTYTKSPEFVRIFGNSGYKINMSIAAYEDENGKIRMNEDEGFNWDEAKKLRESFPNAGVMLMATSDNQIQMALDSDWIDMFIPFHASSLPKAVWYNMRAWQDYSSVQNEAFLNGDEMKAALIADGVQLPKKIKASEVEQMYLDHFKVKTIIGTTGKNKGKRLRPHFLPGPTVVDGQYVPGHNNDTERYMQLCREYGVHPRFYGVKVKDAEGNTIDITEHPNYIKCIKETARTDSPQTAIQFNFDQPSEALGGKTPIDYAFEELQVRAAAEMQAAGAPVRDIYKSLEKDTFGIVPQFIDTIIKHKEKTGKDYPLDYITPDSRKWFLTERKALEEAYMDVDTIPYHRNEYDVEGEPIKARITEMSAEDQAEVQKAVDFINGTGTLPEGYVAPASDNAAELRESQVSFSIVRDQAEIDRLNSEPYEEVFHAMQKITMPDGRTYLFPPMAAVQGGSYVEGILVNEDGTITPVWERADEHPELAFMFTKGKRGVRVPDGAELTDGTITVGRGKNRKEIPWKFYDGKPLAGDVNKETGEFEPSWYFSLKKGNKGDKGEKLTDLEKVAYDPYQHSGKNAVNDQFTTAYDRSHLVIVKVRVPKSELSGESGYVADRAKLGVGTHKWTGGKLKTRSRREVTLSRWDMPVEILSDEQVAQEWKNVLDENGLKSVPFNIVTPGQREALVKLGVTIAEPTRDNAGKAAMGVYNEWKKTQGTKTRKDVQEALAEANRGQKKADGNYPTAADLDIVSFRLSNNNRTTIGRWLDKWAAARVDEAAAEKQKQDVLDYLDRLSDSAMQLAWAKWFCTGAVQMGAEDMPKVRQAVKIAKAHKVDPLQYDSPMAIINQWPGSVKEDPVNPDEVPTLHRAKELPDGIVIYDVDESDESRMNMRQIINTHFGKDCSPWCLLQGNGNGELTANSAGYWKHYNAYPKQVAFKDGKLVAFSANDWNDKVWWDRQDRSHNNIPVIGKVKGDRLGRSATIEYSPFNGEVMMTSNIFKGSKDNGTYLQWHDLDEDVPYLEETYKDGKLNGKTVARYPNGNLQDEHMMVDGYLQGERVQYYPDGVTVRARSNYIRSNSVGEQTAYYENGAVKSVSFYDENSRPSGEWKEYDMDGRLTADKIYEGDRLTQHEYAPDGTEIRLEIFELNPINKLYEMNRKQDGTPELEFERIKSPLTKNYQNHDVNIRTKYKADGSRTRDVYIGQYSETYRNYSEEINADGVVTRKFFKESGAGVYGNNILYYENYDENGNLVAASKSEIIVVDGRLQDKDTVYVPGEQDFSIDEMYRKWYDSRINPEGVVPEPRKKSIRKPGKSLKQIVEETLAGADLYMDEDMGGDVSIGGMIDGVEYPNIAFDDQIYDELIDSGYEEEELGRATTAQEQAYALVQEEIDYYQINGRWRDEDEEEDDEPSFRTVEQREQLFSDAKDEFGTTTDLREAGYLLPDGTMLDFSEKRDGGQPGRRSEDHRAIARVINDRKYETMTEYLDDFISEGAIRLMPESGAFSIAQQPTRQQKNILRSFIYRYNGEVEVEIYKDGHSVADPYYRERTSPARVLSDIDAYFNDGTIPEGNEPMFRTVEITPEVRQEMDVIEAVARVNGTYLKGKDGVTDTKLSPEQWALVRTSAFREWFGDWEKDPENASKVVDEETGEPMVVYHGTNKQVNEFASSAAKVNNTVGDPDGFYFTNDWMQAGNYSRASVKKTGDGKFNVQSVFLNLRNPVDATDAWKKNKKKSTDKRKTYSEVKRSVYNTFEDGVNDGYMITSNNNAWEYVAISPNQIKSATDNNGNFDPNDPDIRFKVRTKEEFDSIRDKAAEEKGIVVDGLWSKTFDVLAIPKHHFSPDENGSVINEARKWAKEHIAKTLSDIETGGKGSIVITSSSIGEMLERKAVEKSENLGLHLAVLESLHSIIKSSQLVETHPDYKKGKDGVRKPENGFESSSIIHRLYAPIYSLGNSLLVKITIKEKFGEGESAYTYEVTKIELKEENPSARKWSDIEVPEVVSSLSAAKVLKGIRKSYDPEIKVLDAEYRKAYEEGDMKKAQSLVDTAAESSMADSQVRDAAGKLLHVYHGTKADKKFWIFDTYNERSNGDLANVGSHFGPKGTAEEFSKDNLYDVYLNMKKVYDAPFDFFADNYNNAYLDVLIDLKNNCESEEAQKIFDRIYDVYPVLSTYNLDEINIIEEFDEDEALEEMETRTTKSGMKYTGPKYLVEHRNAMVEIMRDMMEAEGFDGISYDNWYEGEFENKCYVALYPSQIKSADPVTYDNDGNVIPLSKRFNPAEEDIRFRTLNQVNDQFNVELAQQIDGTLPKGHIYDLGMPSAILESTGIPRLPITLRADKLADKAANFGHDFDLSDVKDLPMAIQQPIAIFAYGDKEKSQNLVIEFQKDGKNFIAGLSLNPNVNGRSIEVNSVRNIFPKDNAEWLNWISQGKLLRVDKERIQDLIDKQRTNLADVEYLDLDSVANIINNFENPTLPVKYDVTLDTNFRVTEQQDADYREAYEAGDTETAMRMVKDAFKAAYPDTRVVDENGDPVIMYHGGKGVITTFDKSYIGSNMDYGTMGSGFYFTSSKQNADNYAKNAEGESMPNTTSVFLNATRLKDVRWNELSGESKKKSETYTDRWKGKGFDAFVSQAPNGATWIVAFEPNQIKSADPFTFDDNGKLIPLSERFNPASDDIRFRTLTDVNDAFNSRLQEQIEGKLAPGFVYDLGMPSEILLSAGIADLPIQLASSRLVDKSMQDNHPFDLGEIKDLPRAIQDPLMVMRSATQIGSSVILTNLHHGDKTFVAALSVNKRGNRIYVNSIRSVHYRSAMNLINLINDNLADYIRPGFMDEWFEPMKKELLSKPQYNSADVRKQLSSAANIINNFENPTLPLGYDINLDTNFRITEQQDADYRKAYETNDTEAAQTILDKVAKAAGYRYKAFHGTPDGGFTVFDNSHRYGEIYFTDNEYIANSYKNYYAGENPTVYASYLRMPNPLRYDAKRKSYNELADDNKIEKLVSKARENGNGGVIIKNVYDSPSGWSKDPANLGTDYLVLGPSNIKSADPFTFDDNGNLIPLSERFNAESDDIRFRLSQENVTFDGEDANELADDLINGVFRETSSQENAGDLAAEMDSEADGQILFRFIGEGAADRLDQTVGGRRILNLAEARKYHTPDSAENIKMAYGWELDKDAEGNPAWKYEEPDFGIGDVTLRDGAKLSDVISDENLFAAYPELADYKLRIVDGRGYFSASDRIIGVSAEKDKAGQRLTLIHEIQHYIQVKEGWSEGTSEDDQLILDAVRDVMPYVRKDMWMFLGSFGRSLVSRNAGMEARENYRFFMDKWGFSPIGFALSLKKNDFLAYEAYMRNAGEVEARNSAARADMTESERRRSLARNTEDRPRSRQWRERPFEDVMFSVKAQETARKAMSGLQLFDSESVADMLMKTFEDVPEEFRARITDEAPAKGYNFGKATVQTFANLAEKEGDLTTEEWNAIATLRDNMKEALGIDILSLNDTLWSMYQTSTAGERDILAAARRAIVADKLGHSPAEEAKRRGIDDELRFSIRREMESASAANMYNRAANYWLNRLKEGFVDMNESVNDLVTAIEKATGMKAEAFEDVRLALNQQSSKGLAAMSKYTSDYLEPLWSAIGDVMKATGMSYDDVVRYVMLKHAVERNDVFARRDAKAFYRAEFDKVVDPLQKDRRKLEKDRRKALAVGDIITANDCDNRIQAIDLQIAAEQKRLDRHNTMVDNGTAAKYKELREQDYGGLTSMYSEYPGLQPREYYKTDEEYNQAARKVRKPLYQTVAEMEVAALGEVDAFERRTSGDEFDRLWEKTNAATKATLESQYKSNVITREQYESARDQFKYYVPLRGFKDTTAEDIWTYFNTSHSGSFSPALLGAKGRKSEAENPFNWIGTMASSAIAQNLKNESKLALYYFIANRPDQDLMTIKDVWYQFDPVATSAYQAANPGSSRKIFAVAYPPFNESLDTDAAKLAYDLWEDNMKQQAQNGLAFRRTNTIDVKDDVAFIDNREAPQHVIRMKLRGKDVSLILNGNPRAAQAINGMLNIETEGGYQKIFGPLLRWMSAVNTSYNPEFWISNMQRDLLFATMGMDIKGDGASNLYRNLVNPRKIMDMMKAYKDGTLGNSEVENYYREFAESGAITGFTVVSGNETWEKEIAKFLDPSLWDRMQKSGFMQFWQDLGEAVEQMTRFSAYMTARKSGKDIIESTDAAKEITVNFNRKGSGKHITVEELNTLTTKDGRHLGGAQKAAVYVMSLIPAYGRRMIMFFNAATQGLNAMYKLWRKNRKKFAGWMAGYFTVGVMQAVLHALVDDDDDYLDMPEYTRRNNLLLGYGGIYLKWAMPQEARAFYAMGDMFVNDIMGRTPDKNVVWEASKAFLDVMPISATDGVTGVLPSAAQPFIELYTNKDFSGARIYNDMRFLSEDERSRTPRHANALPKTGRIFVNVSKALNDISGGDDWDAGFINVHPEAIQHVVEGAGGGLLKTLGKVWETAGGTIDAATGAKITGEEVSVRRFPFLNRMLEINDERTRNSHVSELFYYYKSEAEHVKTKMGKIRKAGDTDAMSDLMDSKEYGIYLIYKSYEKLMRSYDEQIKVEEDRDEKKALMREQDQYRKDMIREISELK